MPPSPFCDTLLDDNCCVHWGAYRIFDETVHSGFTASTMQTRVLGAKTYGIADPTLSNSPDLEAFEQGLLCLACALSSE